jgi:hypothetical protein
MAPTPQAYAGSLSGKNKAEIVDVSFVIPANDAKGIIPLTSLVNVSDLESP